MRHVVATSIVCGCGPAASAGDGTTSGSGSTEVAEVDTGGSSGGGAVTLSSSAGTVSSSTSDATSDDEGVTFVGRPDDGGSSIECDLWAEDCPKGEKCMPWANDGGMAWNATKCVDVVRDPKRPGEPCTVQEHPWSGVDDCELHAACWGVDPETLAGECYAFCSGSEANPTCEDPQSICRITSDTVGPFCVPTCHPFVDPCPVGEVCITSLFDEFACVPDASGDMGAFGDPCEFVNECDPGLFCANPDAVPGCVGSPGCCAPYCDTTAAEPCPAADEGVQCLPWYEEGQAPPGFESVGACAIPA